MVNINLGDSLIFVFMPTTATIVYVVWSGSSCKKKSWISVFAPSFWLVSRYIYSTTLPKTVIHHLAAALSDVEVHDRT